MKLLSKSELVKKLIVILIIMVVVKAGWLVFELTMLGAKGIDYTKPSESKALYYSTRFAAQKLREKKKIVPKVEASSISDILLLAIYRSNDRIVVTVSKQNKSSVLVKGESIDGYTLDDATSQEAIFIKGGKSYRIKLQESKGSTVASKSVRSIPKAPVKKEKKKNSSAKAQGEIKSEDGVTAVDKSLIEHYTQNMDDIWKDIGISEKRVGNEIVGFRVNFVKRNSDFAKLGLRRGDMIRSINGEVLDSYAKALGAYKNISAMDDLTLTIKRGKEEMELEYEIR